MFLPSLCLCLFFTKYFQIVIIDQDKISGVFIMSLYYVEDAVKTSHSEGHAKTKGGPQASSQAWVDRRTYVCMQKRKCAYVRDRDRRKNGTMRKKKKTICLIFSLLCYKGSAGWESWVRRDYKTDTITLFSSVHCECVVLSLLAEVSSPFFSQEPWD